MNQSALFTDFYELTMAQLYFKTGLHQQRAQFDFLYRSNPDYGGHQAGYCILAGIEPLCKWISSTRFTSSDIEHLKSHRSSSGRPLFDQTFLNWLNDKPLIDSLDLHSIKEGRVIHPNEPVIIVKGDLVQCQILESALLNTINYQTLVATKASRIREVGGERTLIEFGMRRAHSQAADAGTRAALIGGAHFSSNTAVSYDLGVPPKGTLAHSMIQVFLALGEGELAAFEAYAHLYPDDCLLLVDTINTLESGVPNAIRVFEKLRAAGHKPAGIRLDSGDLAHLAVRSTAMLDEAGFTDTKIVLSNNIDELVLMQIFQQIREEAPRWGVKEESVLNKITFGVGTRLITSEGHSALDGVYKLTALEKDGSWKPALKISDSPEKVITPGEKQVWRLYDKRGIATADLVCEGHEDPQKGDASLLLRHPSNPEIARRIQRSDLSEMEPLHFAQIEKGSISADFPDIAALRKRRDYDLAKLDTGVRRIINPHIYQVFLSDRLWEKKAKLIKALNEGSHLR